MMRRAFNEVHTRASEQGLSMRAAAYAGALERIASSVQAQGTSLFFAPHERTDLQPAGNTHAEAFRDSI